MALPSFLVCVYTTYINQTVYEHGVLSRRLLQVEKKSEAAHFLFFKKWEVDFQPNKSKNEGEKNRKKGGGDWYEPQSMYIV